MAISPPSDLILDVAKAADPMEIKQAANRLKTMAATASGADFSLAFDSAKAGIPGAAAFDLFRPGSAAETPAQKSPAEKFEAMILTQFVETMLPKDAEMVFGKGTTGEIWKSMLAEQVAGQLAASGGVGVADLISDTLTQGAKT
ncbi:rod-binding protein [Roseibium sp.]|uniref:rod-binding protein n=1 Tax=Roseibium sp. TaxID=1936156 RepID=UPI003B523F56